MLFPEPSGSHTFRRIADCYSRVPEMKFIEVIRGAGNVLAGQTRIMACGSLPTTPLGLTTGFFAGGYGALIGAGSGFVLVPSLLLIYPRKALETITSNSLAVVFFRHFLDTRLCALR